MNPKDKSYITLSLALRQVLARPKFGEELIASETQHQAMEKLKIDDGMRLQIINILNDIESKQLEKADESDGSLLKKPQEMESNRDFLFESFRQLRAAYHTSMTMSIIIFFIGLAFLVIAAIRSFTEPSSIRTTSVIGGIGVVTIVALFYRNPLSDIARTVSNTQQWKLAVMSYLLGITLLNKQIQGSRPTDAHLNNLINLTERALKQLKTGIEGGEDQTRIPKSPSSNLSTSNVEGK
jgi:hypothetical protein